MKEYTIKEFAEKIHVSAETVRRWDRSGKLRCTKRTKSGYRIYTDDDVSKVLSKKVASFVTSRNFDIFKSSTCHHVKYNLKQWILDVLDNDRITEYLKTNMPEYAYYTLAMLDKKLADLDLPIPEEYNWMRKTKLDAMYYPCSHSIRPIDLATADPDFLKYNIVEGDVDDVI